MFLFAVLILPAGRVHAQQLALNNNYIVQPFSFSPAWAGAEKGVEVFAFYRQDWLGFDGAPETKSFLASGQINNKMGLGGSITSQSAGIFRNLAANLSYAYHLRFAEEHRLGFALTAGIVDQYIELANGTASDQQDPLANLNAMVVRHTTPDFGFSGLYRWKNLSAAFYAPQLLESETEDRSSVGTDRALYTLKRHGFGVLSYRHELKMGLALEPFVIVRRTLDSPLQFDMSLKTSFRKQAWLGLGYRKGGSMMVALGGVYRNLILHYGYEFSGDGMLSQSNGTHEAGIGYRFGGGKGDSEEVPEPSKKKPFYKWVQ